MPKVSVIMPTYNGHLYIEKAVESVLNQTLEDFELLIVDDGSKDETPALLAAIAKKDPRVKIITRAFASGGPTIPKNLALSQVHSPYVCFLDHDDYYHPEKLAQMCAGMDAHPGWVAAFHDLQLVDSDENQFSGTYLSNAEFLTEAADYLTPTNDGWFDLGPDFYIFMSLRFAGMHTDSVILAPQRLLADPVSFRLRFRGSDDTDLWLRAGSQGSIGFLDIVLAYYRQHDTNLSSDKVAMAENGVEVHKDNFLRAKHRLSSSQLLKYRSKLISSQSDFAYFLYKDKQFSKALAVYTDLAKQGVIFEGLRGIAKTSLLQVMNKGSDK